MSKIIVIGLSAASLSFIVKLRSFDKNSEIICFSGESYFPYNRCLLADFLTGDCSYEKILLRPEEFFEQNNITVHLNSWVTQIDTQQKNVHVGSEQFEYDTLFIGIGTRPYIPEVFKNIPVQNVFTFHSLQDMQKISNFIETHKPQKALVIGGGINGLEAASSLLERKIQVTVVEKNTRILATQVDEFVSDWTFQKMKSLGVACILGDMVTDISVQENLIFSVQLASGEQLQADFIVVATGAVLNSELLQNSGLQLDQGSLVVDDYLRTNVLNVLAGGDICMVSDMRLGRKIRSTMWSDAMLQGLCAATNLSAAPRKYQGIIGLRDSHLFGYDFYACGKTFGYDQDVQIVCRASSDQFSRLYFKDNILCGFVLMGNISRLSEYKKWYMTGELVDHKIL